MSAPRYEHRLNGARLSGLDPALTLAASVMIVAVADARDFDYPARQADAVGWLTQGAGRHWCEMLGADELLADALAELD